MSISMLENLIKISRGFFSLFNRGYKFHTVGLIPSRGLKGTREEEYFTRQNNKILEYLKEKEDILNKECDKKPYSFDNPLDQDPILRACNSTSAVRHKNLVEEAYFLNEHCDCLQILKSKLQEQDDRKKS